MGKTIWQLYVDMAKRFLDNSLKGVESLEDWKKVRPDIRRQFLRSIGLDQMPEKTALKTTEHGELTGDGFKLRKLSYQILPDCWGTGIVFLPHPLPKGKLPGLLYVCGHDKIGVHGYAKHGIMHARRGYVCLIIDTIQQHDNPGTHQGLGSKLHYEWISMGYPGCCGEVWNSIRGVDLISSFPEVDAKRIGITGTSGGGSLSFLTGLADERIAATASSCGVTTPYYTIANRHMMNHCDCMFIQNVFQRDTSEFAALMAPRPLLFCYGDDDALFSRDEYAGMVAKTKKIYQLHGSGEDCELFEYPGPHGYTQQSIDRVNQWFDQHLAGEERPMIEPESSFKEIDLTIFNGAPPVPNRTNLLPELLTNPGSVPLPMTPAEWPDIRQRTVDKMKNEIFHVLEADETPMEIERVGDWTMGGKDRYRRYRCDFDGVEAWMVGMLAPESDAVVVTVSNADQNSVTLLHKGADFIRGRSAFLLEARGCGTTSTRATALPVDRDNFILQTGTIVGVTPVMLIIQDLKRVVDFVSQQPETAGKPIILHGAGEAAVACLHHAAMNEKVAGVVTDKLPGSHRDGAYIPGILRILDVDQLCGLIAPRPLGLIDAAPGKKLWMTRLYERLGISDRIVMKCQSTAAAVDEVVRLAKASD